jgi:hypothetical protein
VADGELDSAVARLRDRYDALRRGPGGRAAADPRVSVVIPVHVEETRHTFLSALATLLDNRECPAAEVIVVLNGHVPTSALMASPLHAIGSQVGLRLFTLSYLEDARYRNIRRPMNIFVPKQFGFAQARGGVVIAADIDWVFPPLWIREYVDFFDRHPDALAGYGPHHFEGATDRVVRVMGWISTLMKAAKILVDFPPFAGHNHALRREVGRSVPHFYEMAEEDCQEVPAILRRALGLDRRLSDMVRCVPGAASSTDVSGQSATLGEATRWFVDSARRNVRNYERVRRLVRGAEKPQEAERPPA